MTEITSICVYCGSQKGENAKFIEQAQQMGRVMARNNVRLVYGAGTRGLMGTIAEAVHSNGGLVTGIIPEFLLHSEAAHKPELYCDEVVVTASMHERKQKMFEHSDAFIAMPGGIGTLEELVEIMTWAQLGRHEKPIGLLNVDGFWDPFLDLLKHMDESGFLHTASKIQPKVFEDGASILDVLTS